MRYESEDLGLGRYEITFEDGSKTTVATSGDPSEVDGLVQFFLSGATGPNLLFADVDAAKRAMVQWINEFLSNVTGPVPEDEKLAWSVKEEAARALLAGTAVDEQTALITSEAKITGEKPSDLAMYIIAKADRYKEVVANVSGLRRATGAALEAELNPENYPAILEAAKNEARSLAAQILG